MNIIDIENGSFTLNSGMVLKARQHFEDVDRFAIPKTVTDMKNGYEWIYFSNLKIENLYFNLSVCFFKQKAKFITFSFSDSDPTAKSWSDWIETDEEKKIQKFEDWINKVAGARREFSWGSISSNYDPKGGGASIMMDYK